MSDPVIMFVKPAAISNRDKVALRRAGVIVVEIDDPANAKLVCASAELDASAMLACAAKAIADNPFAGVREEFARAICAAIKAQYERGQG